MLTRADHATRRPARSATQAVDPLAYDPRQRINVPPLVPAPGVINHTTIKVFNELWYRKAPRRRIGHVESIPGFFHPLDMVGSWNRLYGRAGFLQYQLLLPFGAEDDAARRARALRRVGRAELPQRAQALRRGEPGAAQLPRAGLDADRRRADGDAAGCARLFHALDELVLDAGGRHYLAKDAHTTPDADPPRLPAPRRVAGRAGVRRSRPASGPATWPAASHLLLTPRT